MEHISISILLANVQKLLEENILESKIHFSKEGYLQCGQRSKDGGLDDATEALPAFFSASSNTAAIIFIYIFLYTIVCKHPVFK